MINVAELEVVTEEPPQQSAEEPPQRSTRNEYAVSRRAPLWADVPAAQWDDWRWQLSHRLNSLDELASIINLTPEEVEGIRSHHFRVDITPYFASLIDPDDPNCPIRRQVIPTSQELVAFDGMVADSLNEDGHSPVPGLVHRYPDRVLMLVTTQCASYCRYCTRSRIVGDASHQFGRGDYGCQRGAQLVADVGHEAPLPLDPRGDSDGHLVERVRDRVQVRVPGVRQPYGQVTGGQALSALPHAPQRAHQQAPDVASDGSADDKGAEGEQDQQQGTVAQGLEQVAEREQLHVQPGAGVDRDRVEVLVTDGERLLGTPLGQCQVDQRHRDVRG